MLKAFAVHVVTLMCFGYIVLSLHPTHDMFMQDDAIAGRLLNQGQVDVKDGGPYAYDFFAVQDAKQWFEWARGPMVSGLFPVAWYNGAPYTPSERGYVLGTTTRLLGAVRSRGALGGPWVYLDVFSLLLPGRMLPSFQCPRYRIQDAMSGILYSRSCN